jgi:hypothetical protein
MKRKIGIAALLFAATACSGEHGIIDEAVGTGEDVGVDSADILNGTSVTAAQNPKVVALYHQAMCEPGNSFCPVQGQFYWFPRPCSATILRSTAVDTWILTARHCVTTNGTIDGTPLSPNQIVINTSVSAGPALPSPPVGSFLAGEVVAPAAAGTEAFDLALVRVFAQLPVSAVRVSIPIWQGAVNLPNGAPLAAFGFGRKFTHQDPNFENGESGAGVLRRAFNLPFLSACFGCVPYGSYTYTDWNASSQAVVNGDSGGPTFLQASLSTPFYQLIGVHSTACWTCTPKRGTDALTIKAATGLIRTYLGYLFVSSHGQPDRNMSVNGAIASGALVGTSTVKDTAQTHWMYDPGTLKIYTTVGATRFYLTARTPNESFGAIDRRVYITSANIGNGYQQWHITPDFINNLGTGSTGNAEILNEFSPGVLTVGPYFSYPATTRFAWHPHP